MIEIDVPGDRKLQLKHIVLDYNGTIACDGKLIENVKKNLVVLADHLQVHILTADTFGKAHDVFENLDCRLSILSPEAQDIGKLNYIETLGAENVVCVGNGRNDRLMLEKSALGIAVIMEEGAAAETVAAADVVCTHIVSALQLLLNPLRLIATLRT